ncbi:putative lipoprotein [Bacteriovorax sp. Seq25_V]|uniref:putative lipoprotein n=1 Tax=Bacteriovorax sp. Seq25_V TaxID=1201288 RepID=UPI00038A3E66|nr:putative lipoprotein [Bacteriovorax sp. Seq25_V]EQC45375.1 putative lipoprotein [Bacteriovorax sp. Seq25_V]
MKKLFLILSLITLASCSSKPVLYPNQKLKTVGKEKSQQDIDNCMAEADTFLESEKGKKMVKSAGAGAFMGAAMGAVSGLIFGDVKRAVTSGAAIGGTAGAAGAAISPDELKQRYVNRCLAKQGYDVMGWN